RRGRRWEGSPWRKCSGDPPNPPRSPAILVRVDRVKVPLGDEMEVELIVIEPSGSPTSAVIRVHGGGGSAETMQPPAQALAEAGHLSVAMSMRGWGGSGGVDDCG